MVTTARLTSAENCWFRSGEIVISAINDCRTPMITMPTIGAPAPVALLKTAGKSLESAASFAVEALPPGESLVDDGVGSNVQHAGAFGGPFSERSLRGRGRDIDGAGIAEPTRGVANLGGHVRVAQEDPVG